MVGSRAYFHCIMHWKKTRQIVYKQIFSQTRYSEQNLFVAEYFSLSIFYVFYYSFYPSKVNILLKSIWNTKRVSHTIDIHEIRFFFIFLFTFPYTYELYRYIHWVRTHTRVQIRDIHMNEENVRIVFTVCLMHTYAHIQKKRIVPNKKQQQQQSQRKRCVYANE